MDSADQRDPRALRLTTHWAVSIPLLPGEIFSSWLVRASFANGTNPMSFAGAIWPMWRAWTKDLDRRLPEEQQISLSRAGGPTKCFIEETTLHKVAGTITGKDPPSTGFWPWILTIGLRNRTYKRGIQYCPQCLASDPIPYFRQQWRLAWHTSCAEHQRSLGDRCPHCLGAIQYHRLTVSKQSLRYCSLCHKDLAQTPAKAMPEVAALLNFQDQADDQIKRAYDSRLKADECVDWFSLATFYSLLARRTLRASTLALHTFGKLCELHEEIYDFGVTPIEQMHIEERVALFHTTARLMSIPLEQLATLLREAGVSRQGLCPPEAKLPASLTAWIETLPSSQKNTSLRKRPQPKSIWPQPRSRWAVEQMWARLRSQAKKIE